MLRLGHAVGQVLRQGERRPTVLIGKDTRISGYMIESALEAGFASAGVDVVLTGPLPTPGVAYLTRALRLDLGVVISASHNPFADNGIKFFSARGEKLPDAWEAEVEAALAPSSSGSARPSSAGAPARRRERALRRVLQEHLQQRPDAARPVDRRRRCPRRGLSRRARGLPRARRRRSRRSAAGPTASTSTPASARRRRRRSSTPSSPGGADYGIALDGDGDRLQVVDAAGRLYNGDELLYVLAAARLDHGRPVPGVVGTLMTNLGVEQALRRRGVEVVRTAVGDRYVLEELLRRGWQLGGEGSGHLLALDRHTTGDGIVSALMVLEAVVRSGRPLATCSPASTSSRRR
jgi:phosphoglucosamine mutase